MLFAVAVAVAAPEARVVVLAPPDRGFERRVRARLRDRDVALYPATDLYQAGRREPGVAARDQRAIVPPEAIAAVTEAVDDVPLYLIGSAMTESDWGEVALELRGVGDQIWFVDRPELRPARFRLWVILGLAAERANYPAPPYYREVDHFMVNWYWYLAGAMAYAEPELMERLTDQDLYGSVDYYKQLLDDGKFEPFTITFLDDGLWDRATFEAEYRVFVDGLEVRVDDDSLLRIPPGRADLYLQRADGSGLSERIDASNVPGHRFHAALDVDDGLAAALIARPDDPAPGEDALADLAIYAKLHAAQEIFVAMPDGPRVRLWRWEPTTLALIPAS